MTLFTRHQAPEGRDTPIETSDLHTITGHSIHPPFAEGYEEIVLGMGCFRGVEPVSYTHLTLPTTPYV